MVHEILISLDGIDVCEVNITYDNLENSPYSVKLPCLMKKFSCLQDKDLKVRQAQTEGHPRTIHTSFILLKKVYYTGP